MLVCRTLLLGARPAVSPDSTSTHPAPRADPRDALDAMRHDHRRPGDRPRGAASRRDGRHSHRIHRNLERSREPAFSNSPHPPPDVMTKGDSRRRRQGPRPCRRSTTSAAPGVRGIVVGRAPPPATHPRRPRVPAGRASPPASPRRAPPRRRAPLRDHTEGHGAGTGGAGKEAGGAGSSGGRHADPALRPSGTGRRGVPRGRGRRGSCRRRRAGTRGRSRRGQIGRAHV